MRVLALLFLCTILRAAPAILRVRLKPAVSSATIDMPLEQYVAAVLAGESSTFKSDEAMKAMAVAIRTFAIHFRARHAKEGYDLCGTTHCQRLEPDLVTERLQSLADATAGELLWYEGKPAYTAYSRNCGGMTEDSTAVWDGLRVPFLRAHPDPWCQRPAAGRWQWSVDAQKIAAALQRSKLQVPADLRAIQVAQRTPSGRARVLLLSGSGEPVRLAASSFRFAIGRAIGWNSVRSDRWEVTENGGHLLFEGAGEGHGVGMCQRGADQMGVEGHGYREILAFYFPGTATGLNARGLGWRRMSGENVALMTTLPDRDRAVLATAERQVKEISAQYGWPIPAKIEIRVYPDVETFRNATGEPGWVAARTTARRIELQPAAPRDATLRHELLHVFVESQAVAQLPVWFREGLAGYLAHATPGAATEFADRDIRQTENESRARTAYAAATRKVAALVQRYGAPTVLAFLKTGLPK
ncbi:MAG: SpoIID/LytB domain [Candidatus Solibacter sp.]|nr:SpoIID/LytB domain [Candidatus Solibacter sp.]